MLNETIVSSEKQEEGLIEKMFFFEFFHEDMVEKLFWFFDNNYL